jgi:hypothetical protein
VLLASTARTAWKNPTSSRMRNASSCGTASAKAWERSVTHEHAARSAAGVDIYRGKLTTFRSAERSPDCLHCQG